MKFFANSAAIAILLAVPLLSSNAAAATDSEQYARCKSAAQSEYGESTRVKLIRVKRYKGSVTVKLRVQSEQENAGGRFISICKIEKDGTLDIAAR